MMKKNGIRLTIGDLVMKKTHFFTAFCGLLAALSFVSCNNETDSGDDTEKEVVVDTTAEKIALYNKLVGTSWKDKDTKDAFENYRTLSFSDTAVTINGTVYPLNLKSDLYYYSEIENAAQATGISAEDADHALPLYIYVTGRYIGCDNYTFDTPARNYLGLWITDSSSYTGLDYTSYKQVTSSSDSSSSGSGSGSGSSTSTTSSVNGTYTYTATGTAQSGSLTLKDGTWSYSGDKTALSVKSGSYTVSGSKITVSWSSNGYDSTETFTISNSGSQSTWTSENESVSVFFVTIFTNSSKTLTFTKS